MAPLVEIQAEKLAALAEAESTAASLDDVPDAITLLIERLATLTDAAGVILDLERDGELVASFATAQLQEELGRVRDVATTGIGRCFTSDRMLRTPNLHRDPRFLDVGDLPTDAVSMISVPLHVHGPAVGLLRVVSPRESHFTLEDVDVARLMTGCIARILMHAVRVKVRAQSEGPSSLSPAAEAVHFEDRRRVELSQAARYGYAVTVVHCHIDGYVTAEVLEMVPSLVRSTDGCFRLDAAEFAILMPATSREQATKAAERIRSKVETAGDGVRLEWTIASPEVVAEVA